MSISDARAKLERLELSDEENTEDLWTSPSQRQPRSSTTKTADSSYPRNGGTEHDKEDAREASLKNELESVRHINEVIEGVLESLDRAKGNMENVSRTVRSADTLLNTWTRILSQTEQNQRLILNPGWQGATQDMADIENESILKQQEVERKELELQQRKEALARKAEEDRKKAEAASKTRGGTSTGRTRGLVRTRSTTTSSAYARGGTRSTSTSSAARGSTSATRRPTSEIPRGSSIARSRGRARGSS